MSSRYVGLGLGALLCWAVPLPAQDSLVLLRGMENRLDSLRMQAASVDSAEFQSAAEDTVVVGSLRIATSARFRPVVEQAAAEAWRNVMARFSGSIKALGPLPIVQFGGAATVVSGPVDPHELARGLESAAAQAIWRRQDASLVGWLGGSVPVGPLIPEYRVGIAEELVRTPARPNVACLEGNTAACAVALGLRVGSDPLAEWYTPATWPRLARMIPGELSGQDKLTRNQCADTGDVVACRAVLVPGRLLLPVGSPGRQYLVELALRTGGAGAFDRLVADTAAALEHRLAAAAGIPADSLVASWARAVWAAAPEGPLPGGSEAALTLAWSAVVLTLAARGSRWR